MPQACPTTTASYILLIDTFQPDKHNDSCGIVVGWYCYEFGFSYGREAEPIIEEAKEGVVNKCLLLCGMCASSVLVPLLSVHLVAIIDIINCRKLGSRVVYWVRTWVQVKVRVRKAQEVRI
jgi:hypothetical protein